MKTLLIAPWSMMLLAASCDSEQKIEPPLEPATYIGEFFRSSPNADWRVANVTITFEHGSFIGESDIRSYPAICRGTYKVVGNKITFENECFFTAEFDWTFILDGDFLRETHGDEIWLTREYGDNVFDLYKLRRQ